MMRRPFMLMVSIAALSVFAITLCAQTNETSTPPGTITGRVSSSTGDLPNNVVVYASAPNNNLGGARTTTLNNDGTFKFEGLDVGAYRVWASAPGFVADAAVSTDTRAFVHTGGSTNLSLRKGGVITGTVTNNNAP